jgi:hypothetical protein
MVGDISTSQELCKAAATLSSFERVLPLSTESAMIGNRQLDFG